MSKETMIIFVYDLTKKVENDDPTGSIIYFHPMWVSELQKKSLCGQLMGSTYFLGETLAKVRFIALQNGKFALRPHGRFMLAVGSDRNVPDSILEYRANLLSTLIELFHGNFNTLYNVFVEKEQKNGFNEKVFCVMESCLPMLQFNGNIFQNMPSLRLPKCASNIYLESNQVLQSFLQNKGVLGGSIFFHNKVLVSQLPTNLTKLLVYSDPYRVKIAETINVTFHVPNGVSLISAYIPKRDYTQLVEATKNIPIYFNNGTTGVATNGGSGPSVPPFAIKKKLIPTKELGGSLGGLKSDKSIIFSHIPEEESVPADGGGGGEAAGAAPRKPFNVSRPTFLPLKFKNLTSRDIIDSGVNSINFDESDSFPNFIGKTSVVSTPLTENKIVPNRNMMSICVTQDKPPLALAEENTNPDAPSTANEEAKITKEKEVETGSSMFKQINSGVPMKYDAVFSHPLLLSTKKCHAISLSTLNERDVEEQDDSTVSEEDEGDGQRKKRMSMINRLISKNYSALKTVADPLYPIVDQRKRAMSYSLFQDFERLRNEHLAELVEQEEEQKGRESKTIPEEVKPVASKSEATAAESIISKPTDDTVPQPPITPLDRRGLSLPIKSFNLNDDHQPHHPHRTTGVGGSTELFTRRKSTLELTPLMTKLTVLAANDPESSGVSSWDTTPGCSYNMAISPQEYIPQRRKSQDIQQQQQQQQQLAAVNGTARDDDDKALVKVELFVCVQQNMTLVLVMQEKNCKNQRLVQTLFESCVSKFLRIENDIQLAMNINVDGYDKAEGYSLIALDADWDVAKKSGPWSTLELQTTESLHTHFRKSNLVTEVTLKSQDSVLYGYQCGMRELFYTQMANAQSGLPPPQDVMGSVPLCAKRRIERDHFALLL